MTLDAWPAAAHAHSVKGGPDPAELPNLPHAEMAAKRAELDMVRDRSHVARVQIAAIDRALARVG